MSFYGALLRLYPASFRVEYEDELRAVHEEEIRGRSRLGAMAAAVRDVVPSAAAVHLDILRQDARYSLRTLRRAPGYALTVIVIVALGIGANTAAFSLASFVLLQPLPFRDSEQLVKIWDARSPNSQNEVSPPNYRDWKSMSKSFSDMAAFAGGAANLVGVGAPRRVEMALVTPELMPLIGVAPALGNLITPANSKSGQVAVLSHDLWRTQFDSDPRIVGRVIRLDGAPHTIVGVMPQWFRFPYRSVELWSLMALSQQDLDDRSNSYFQVIGRLRPGVTIAKAQAEMDTIGARLEQQYPDTNKDRRPWMHRLRDDMGSRQKLLIVALCGAAFCILVLSCANLAGLLLARGANRSYELAIRTALGAGRERLVRQLITETILLALIGGAAGVILAWAGLPLLKTLIPPTLPLAERASIDVRVLVLAAVLMLITALVFGVMPALRARTVVMRQRLRGSLVVVEVVGSMVLLVSSGLLMRAIWRIQSIEPGFRSENVMTMRTALPLPKYAPVAARMRFYRRVLDEIRAIPGVESAAYATGLPMVRTGGIMRVEVAGVDEYTTASLRYVTPGYFATMGIPLVRGRDVADSDAGDRLYVAVVSESFAAQYWPNQDPIGRRFKFVQKERTIVGVVGDVRVRGPERQSEPQVYLPPAQIEDNSYIGYSPADLVIRSPLPPERYLPAVRRIIANADPEQPVSNVKPLAEIVADNTAPRRVQLRILAILSAIALLIAGVGIHGLLSFSITQRTKELGIRRALGAPAAGLMAMVLRHGFGLALTGAAIGIAIAIAVGRGMSAILFGVAPTDAPTIAAAAVLCLVTALLGCLHPTLRAARVDPMVALREG